MDKQTLYPEKLFSYGTLQLEPVQLSTFGRKLHGTQDKLSGYILSDIKITDPYVLKTSGITSHPILLYTGKKSDKVKGMVFEITSQELQQADAYEVKDYKRILVNLDSKMTAWVYVSIHNT